MENNDVGVESSLELFITSNQVASGTIEIYRTGQIIDFSVSPGTTFNYIVAFERNNSHAARGSGNVEQKGIHVLSDADISLYAFNKRFRSADATVVLPTPTLGQEYIVAAYFETSPDPNLNVNNESEFIVVATEDDTSIEINPSTTTIDGKIAKTPFTIVLNQGEIYQLQARGDLTGTQLKSVSADPTVCKNFAVFGGNKWAGVGGCGRANDHLYEQIFPIKTWGKSFTMVPFAGRNSNGDLYRVVTSEEFTKVTIISDDGSSTTKAISTAGNYITENLNTAASIVSDKPIQVIQYSKSQCAEIAGAQTGDPFMLMISPNEQMLEEVTFNTLEAIVIDNYYTTIITNTATRSEVTLSGAAIAPSSWNTLVSDPNFSYSRLPLDGNRNYTVRAPDGFISYVYGFGDIESFGYAAGASLDNLNLEIEGDDEQIGILVTEGCLDSEISFDVLFDTPVGQDPIFTSFDWDFGNGDTASGKNVTYIYSVAGTYNISVNASDGQGACANTESINYELSILDIEHDGIVGPSSVCPDVVDVAYNVQGPDDNIYEWFVSGGNITSSAAADNVLVDWGVANDNAWLKLLVKNRLGCAADTVHFDVKINKRLEPADPVGSSDVCFLDFLNSTYSTPETNGSLYEWFVSGGTILTSNALNEINIQWDGVGTGQVWYREYNASISDCEGFSERLDVIIHSEIFIQETITNTLCFGDANGSISLSVSGGQPGYRAVWDNGIEGLSLDSLAAGSYTVTVYDSLNCAVEQTYEVGEPVLLEIMSPPAISNVRCFQESNGEVQFEALGGTAPYTYRLIGMGIDKSGNTNLITDLIAGTYSLEVFDANNCMTSTEFEVTEPELLEPDLERLINLPICPQASNGEVSIDALGGTPAYQFFWNTNPPQEGTIATGLSQGKYIVTIIDANGCQAEQEVEVSERFPRVYIPNAFSPNGDGENDEFKAVTDCTLSFGMKVFNKWGLIVFSTDDIKEGWDGTYKGQAAVSGIYSYSIFYSGSINNIPFEESIKGTVRLF